MYWYKTKTDKILLDFCYIKNGNEFAFYIAYRYNIWKNIDLDIMPVSFLILSSTFYQYFFAIKAKLFVSLKSI